MDLIQSTSIQVSTLMNIKDFEVSCFMIIIDYTLYKA